jgi:hypothetical protein
MGYPQTALGTPVAQQDISYLRIYFQIPVRRTFQAKSCDTYILHVCPIFMNINRANWCSGGALDLYLGDAGSKIGSECFRAFSQSVLECAGMVLGGYFPNHRLARHTMVHSLDQPCTHFLCLQTPSLNTDPRPLMLM